MCSNETAECTCNCDNGYPCDRHIVPPTPLLCTCGHIAYWHTRLTDELRMVGIHCWHYGCTCTEYRPVTDERMR
jgi:hypothetical protein